MPCLLESIDTILKIIYRSVDLFLSVHHKRPELHHGLTQRLASNQDEPQGLAGSVPHLNPISVAKEEEVVGSHRRGFRDPEDALALEDVDEGVPRGGYWLLEVSPWLKSEVQVHGGCSCVDWGFGS